MKDKLEKFITDHRDEFDLPGPQKDIWPTIDKQLRPKQRRFIGIWSAAAASLLLVISSFVWLTRHTATNGTPPEAKEIKETIVIPEIKEAETYYASVEETKQMELSKFGKKYPGIFKDFGAEIDSLHTSYEQLKTEYKNSDGNELVLHALIENMQLQVQLLNRQLEIIRELQLKENGKKQHSGLI